MNILLITNHTQKKERWKLMYILGYNESLSFHCFLIETRLFMIKTSEICYFCHTLHLHCPALNVFQVTTLCSTSHIQNDPHITFIRWFSGSYWVTDLKFQIKALVDVLNSWLNFCIHFYFFKWKHLFPF